VRWIAVLSSVVLMMGAAPPSAKAVDLVAVRAPLGTADEVFAGCELVRIDADGKTTVLTPEFAAAKDPSVAFDGHTILFAGRRASSDPWQIWRIGSDGSNPTRIIADGGNATAPLHVGSLFHLDDERPTERFVYLSDTHGWVDPFTGKKAIALYAADLDGGNPWRISFNLGSDMAPDVLANGRLVFPRHIPTPTRDRLTRTRWRWRQITSIWSQQTHPVRSAEAPWCRCRNGGRFDPARC
jgi:hypothetical protein